MAADQDDALFELTERGTTLTTRYYFAARYSRNPELRQYRDELLAALPDARVTSRWVDQHGGEVEQSYTPAVLAADPEGCWKYGQADFDDLDAADTVVSFTGGGPGGKGGRHVEYGIALASGKRLVVVGPRENIFHCHPDAEVFDSWEAFLKAEVGR